MKATASIDVDVRPEIVYAFLSDYENSHPMILPENHFTDYEVLMGGIGEGTLIRFRFHLMGLKRVMQAEISEPEPGRLIKETDIDTGAETSFLIEPNDDGLSTNVTIDSEWESKGIRVLFINSHVRDLMYLNPVTVQINKPDLGNFCLGIEWEFNLLLVINGTFSYFNHQQYILWFGMIIGVIIFPGF